MVSADNTKHTTDHHNNSSSSEHQEPSFASPVSSKANSILERALPCFVCRKVKSKNDFYHTIVIMQRDWDNVVKIIHGQNSRVVGRMELNQEFGPITFKKEFLDELPQLKEVRVHRVADNKYVAYRSDGSSFSLCSDRSSSVAKTEDNSSAEPLFINIDKPVYPLSRFGLPTLATNRNHSYAAVIAYYQVWNREGHYIERHDRVVGRIEKDQAVGRIAFSESFIQEYPQLKNLTVYRRDNRNFVVIEQPYDGPSFEEMKKKRGRPPKSSSHS